MRMNKEQVFQGLNCCREFFCDDCPYKIYGSDTYKMPCIRMLIEDLADYSKEIEQQNIKRPARFSDRLTGFGQVLFVYRYQF